MGRESFRVIRRVRVFGDSDTVCTQRQRRGLISAQGIALGAKPDAEYGYRPCRGMDPARKRGMTGVGGDAAPARGMAGVWVRDI